MPRPLRRRLAGLAAAASLQALLGTAAAFGQTAAVRIFEEPPPLELLRGIMVPESRPGGPSRRIVLGNPERPPSPVAEAAAILEPVRVPEEPSAAAAMPRRPRPRQQAAAAAEPGTAVLASARAPFPLPALPEAKPAATPEPAPAAAGSIGFRINFALDSDVVPQSAYAFVGSIGELLRDQPQLRLQVEGHTDALGSDEYNLILSQRRAAAVANYLVGRYGIDPARLVVLGLGESAPLTANGHDPRNRRVQFARVD